MKIFYSHYEDELVVHYMDEDLTLFKQFSSHVYGHRIGSDVISYMWCVFWSGLDFKIIRTWGDFLESRRYHDAYHT